MKSTKTFKLRAIAVAALMTATASAAHAAPAAQAAPAAKAAQAAVDGFAPGRILVHPKAGLPQSEFFSLLSANGGTAVQKVGQSDLHIVTVAHGNEKSVLARLEHNPHLKFAELDRAVKTSFVPNDPYFGSAYHVSIVNATAAWDTTQGEGITIAILDSGVDAGHPDLASKMVPGYNFYDNNADSSDVYGHGTAVAGTAAAITNNGTGVSGIAGASKIMPIRVADTSGYAYYSTLASGLTWAADHGARIANMSFQGVQTSSAIQSSANYMKSKGGVVFASAGNNAKDEGYAPTTSMISVSATNSGDSRPYWSSYGSYVTLSAPGENIWTTSRGGSYGAWNGTSFSSPLAAGVGALVLAANPSLTSAQVESILTSTAKDIGDPGRDIYYGYGRVDAAAAVAAALAFKPAPDTTAPTVSVTSPGSGASVSGTVSVNVSAADNVGIASVQLQVNGTVVATDTTAPYSFSWDSKGVVNGQTTLTAIATDTAGNVAASKAVTVTVANLTTPIVTDTTAPVVRLVNPVAGAVSGNVTVSTSATDNAGAAGISQTLYIDGSRVASGTGSTVSYQWNTKKAKVGAHTVMVVATDKAGTSSSASVLVTR